MKPLDDGERGLRAAHREEVMRLRSYLQLLQTTPTLEGVRSMVEQALRESLAFGGTDFSREEHG